MEQVLYSILHYLMWGVLIGLPAGFLMYVFALPLIPGEIDKYINRPNANRPTNDEEANRFDYTANTNGYFTYVEPGRVKMIERGGRFVRAVMSYPGHKFAGEVQDTTVLPTHLQGSALLPTHREYWEVVRTPQGERDSHPVPFPRITWLWTFYSPFSVLFWLWKRWVYWITGAVFTGIDPYQGIRVYPMTKFVLSTSDGSNGKPAGTIIVHIKRDWSDHYRVAHFQLPVIVPDVNTADKIAVSVVINGIFVVFNPFLTAYYTDNEWSTRLLASVSDAVTRFGREHPLDEVLSAQSSSVSAAGAAPATPTAPTGKLLAQEIARIGRRDMNGSATEFGIMIPDPENDPPQILDISVVDPEHRKKVADLALARVEKEAAKERAIGHAAEITEQGKALAANPEAMIIPRIEGDVRVAQAAGDKAIVVLGGASGGTDPTQLAILAELRRLRGGNNP